MEPPQEDNTWIDSTLVTIHEDKLVHPVIKRARIEPDISEEAISAGWLSDDEAVLDEISNQMENEAGHRNAEVKSLTMKIMM